MIFIYELDDRPSLTEGAPSSSKPPGISLTQLLKYNSSA